MNRFLTLAAAATLSFAGAASAAPQVVEIDDFVEVASVKKGGTQNNMGYASGNFVGHNTNGRNWGDTIGSGFNTRSITITRDLDASQITFTFDTDFNGTKAGADYADIFIDTSTPETPDNFNFGISLGDQTSGSGRGNNGGVAKGVYANPAFKTSNDIWTGNATYGGYLNFEPGTPGYDPTFEMEVATVITDNGTGPAIFGLAVSVQRIGKDLHVNVDGSANTAMFNTIFDNFDILWGTGDCSNDAIWGMVEFQQNGVPAPGAILLMLAGLLGFARMRRATA